MKNLLYYVMMFFLGVAFAALLVWAMDSTPTEELEQREYCEMVEMYRKDPTTGWPDFNETYDSECNPHANESR